MGTHMNEPGAGASDVGKCGAKLPVMHAWIIGRRNGSGVHRCVTHLQGVALDAVETPLLTRI